MPASCTILDTRSALEMSEEERLARYEELWAQPGFAKWFGNFGDTMSDLKAYATMTEFVRNKIRERVNDPVVAEKTGAQGPPVGNQARPLRERLLRGV